MDAQLLHRLAAPHAGIVTRCQLLAADVSGSSIDRALRAGHIRRLARGVYQVTGSPWTRRAAQHAALALAGDDAHLSHWSAAELLGFTDPRPGPVHVTVPHGRHPPADAGKLVRSYQTRSLPPSERCRVGGLATTIGARTLVDLAAWLPKTRLVELVAAAVRVRATDLEQLETVLAAHPSSRGRRAIQRAVEQLGDDGARSRSDVEVAARGHLDDAGLPRPVMAYRVRDREGQFVAEVDLAYPDLRLAIEIDGFLWHSTPAQKRADEERQNRLILAGWTVLRFSAAQVRSDPQTFVGTVARYLATTTISR